LAAKAGTIAELKKQIKDDDIKQVYLFWGDERYLAELYLQKILDAVPDGGLPEFNRFVVEDAKTPVADIMDYLETYPMMSDKKILIIRDSGIFKSAGEELKNFWTKQLADIPEYAVIIFLEREIDKRSVIYKAVEKAGFVLEFAYLSPVDAVTWVERQVLKAKKKIKKDNAAYLVDICDEGLGNLKNELDKLINFCDEEITRSDIERLVSKSLNIRVFEMTDAIMAHDADTALSILSDMKTVKESAFKILYILFGAFDKMLQAELMQRDGESSEIIARKLKVPPFIARKYMKKSFGEDFLTECVIKTAEIDLAIKEGRTDEWTALEQFVAELFLKN
jgi:DNA polymerase-3 subunit delta